VLEKLTSATRVAQGRLDYGPPVAVIDIGSNSVRLVVYEGVTRSPTPLFNEKTLAGLGREVQTKGLLAADAVEKALGALMRFRALCDTMQVTTRTRWPSWATLDGPLHVVWSCVERCASSAADSRPWWARI
jgi:hypothetical protein